MKTANRYSQNNNFTLGLVILLIGLFILLRRLGFFFPDWLFSWPIIFIVMGLVILIKNSFQSGLGFLMLLFGSFFLVKREIGIPVEIGHYAIPVGLIVFGLYLMVYKRNYSTKRFASWEKPEKPLTGNPSGGEKPISDAGVGQESAFFNDSGDILQSQALFCGVQ